MLQIAPEAEQDLIDIWRYIAADSLINADNFIDTIYASALQLADFPLSGRARPDLGEQIFMFPIERYVMFYQPHTDQAGGIVLLRVLHSARDVKPLF